MPLTSSAFSRRNTSAEGDTIGLTVSDAFILLYVSIRRAAEIAVLNSQVGNRYWTDTWDTDEAKQSAAVQSLLVQRGHPEYPTNNVPVTLRKSFGDRMVFVVWQLHVQEFLHQDFLERVWALIRTTVVDISRSGVISRL